MKPVIKKPSRIGRNKFKEILEKDKQIKSKEIQLLSVPGKKIEDVSAQRHKNKVGKDIGKFERLLNQKFIEDAKRKNNIENKAQLLHTHIIRKNLKKEEYGTALPSKSDIISFITDRSKSIKYQIIGVIDPKSGKSIGFTTLKIDPVKITPDKFNQRISQYLNRKNINSAEYKKHIFQMLPSLGIKIVFTPEAGYRLDKKFNYVKER